MIQANLPLKIFSLQGVDIFLFQSKIKELSEGIVAKVIQMITNERQQLISRLKLIIMKLKQLTEMRQQCQIHHDQHQKEISKLQKQLSARIEGTDPGISLQIIQQKQQQCIELWQRRIVIAQGLNIKKLRSVNLVDKFSNTNKIFEVILFVFYNEPVAKYYWPNFRQEAFCYDDGQDFKERLARVDVTFMKEEQKFKMDQFLKIFQQVQNARQFKSLGEQAYKIKDIIEICEKCYRIRQEIRMIKDLIKERQQKQAKQMQQLQLVQSRIQELRGRQTTLELYMNLISSIEPKLQQKQQIYRQRIKLSQIALKRLQQNKLIIQTSDQWKSQQIEACQCRID